MNGQYPRFKNSYFYEELTATFLKTFSRCRFDSIFRRQRAWPSDGFDQSVSLGKQYRERHLAQIRELTGWRSMTSHQHRTFAIKW